MRPTRSQFVDEVLHRLEEEADRCDARVGSVSSRRRAAEIRSKIPQMVAYRDLRFGRRDRIAAGAIIVLDDSPDPRLVLESGLDLPVAGALALSFLVAEGAERVGDTFEVAVGRPGETRRVTRTVVDLF